MILIALGSNLPHPQIGPPGAVLDAALDEMAGKGLRVLAASRYFASAPVPASDQPWYVNAAASVESQLPAAALLRQLHEIEALFGRQRGETNAARILDLDLLAYGEQVTGEGEALRLPHPRLQERAFVLLPLLDIAPEWRHPVSCRSVREMAAALPEDQQIQPLSR
ncbi:MAG: 2-amino-4-hydroxy-6-hydroxymethyldihydropteridine diphosphokinase [Rhodovibrionaceae bacterium]